MSPFAFTAFLADFAFTEVDFKCFVGVFDRVLDTGLGLFTVLDVDLVLFVFLDVNLVLFAF